MPQITTPELSEKEKKALDRKIEVLKPKMVKAKQQYDALISQYLLAVGIAILVWISLGKWRTGMLAPGWKTVGLAAGYSMLIELAQLVSFRGLFEFDDVIHNALGTAIGVLIVLGLRRLLKRCGL